MTVTNATESAKANATAELSGPRSGAEPKGNPAVRWLTILLGLALLALSGVIGRDLWYRYQENDPQNSWVRPALDWLGTATVNPLGVTIGIIVAVVGLWLIITAFKPRPRRYVRVDSVSSIWMRPVDVARKATASARNELGRASIASRATRKKLTLNVEDDGSTGLDQRLTDVLTGEMQRLEQAPRIRVNIHQPTQPKELA